MRRKIDSLAAGPEMAVSRPAPAGSEVPFWRRKTLREMSATEWESLCDGCARCCLNKLEDEETGAIEWTALTCRLLDTDTCRCADYENRNRLVPDCIKLDPENVEELSWLPPTCGYRLVKEGRDLYWWHPLVSGDPATVHAAGISVRDRAVSEIFVASDEWENYIVTWPTEGAAEERKPGS